MDRFFENNRDRVSSFELSPGAGTRKDVKFALLHEELNIEKNSTVSNDSAKTDGSAPPKIERRESNEDKKNGKVLVRKPRSRSVESLSAATLTTPDSGLLSAKESSPRPQSPGRALGGIATPSSDVPSNSFDTDSRDSRESRDSSAPPRLSEAREDSAREGIKRRKAVGNIHALMHKMSLRYSSELDILTVLSPSATTTSTGTTSPTMLSPAHRSALVMQRLTPAHSLVELTEELDRSSVSSSADLPPAPVPAKPPLEKLPLEKPPLEKPPLEKPPLEKPPLEKTPSQPSDLAPSATSKSEDAKEGSSDSSRSDSKRELKKAGSAEYHKEKLLKSSSAPSDSAAKENATPAHGIAATIHHARPVNQNARHYADTLKKIILEKRPTKADMEQKWTRPLEQCSIHADIPRLLSKLELRSASWI